MHGHDLAAPLGIVGQVQIANPTIAILRGQDEIRDLVQLVGDGSVALNAQAKVRQAIESAHGGKALDEFRSAQLFIARAGREAAVFFYLADERLDFRIAGDFICGRRLAVVDEIPTHAGEHTRGALAQKTRDGIAGQAGTPARERPRRRLGWGRRWRKKTRAVHISCQDRPII